MAFKRPSVQFCPPPPDKLKKDSVAIRGPLAYLQGYSRAYIEPVLNNGAFYMFILIGIALGVYLGFTESNFDTFAEKFIFLPLLMGFGGILGGLSGSLIAVAVGALMRPLGLEDKKEIIPIFSLQDNIGLASRFALGAGYVESTAYFFYLVETEHGKKVEKAEQQSTYIKTTTDPPYIEKTETVFKYDWMYLLGLPPFWKKRTVLFVPEDTIKIGYSVDLT